MKFRDGEMSILRRGDKIDIEIQDESSRCLALEIEVGFENFAKALTAFANQDCRYSVNESGVLGKIHQHKEEIVEFPEFSRGGGEKGEATRNRIISEALVPFEVDGWKARRSDATNGHRWAGKGPGGGNLVRVVFFRHVDPPDGPDDSAEGASTR